LLSSPTTAKEIVRQFYIANRALFDTHQKMHLDLKAANQFDVEDEELAQVFEKRNISAKEYGPLFQGQFRPYTPSDSIIEKFYQKAEEFSATNPMYGNPFEEALPILTEMIEEFSGSDLSKSWKFKPSDFGIQEEQQSAPSKDPFKQSALPPQPMPSANVVQTAAMPAPGTMNQGLTAVENALLSDEEKQIRLRQRGLA